MADLDLERLKADVDSADRDRLFTLTRDELRTLIERVQQAEARARGDAPTVPEDIAHELRSGGRWLGRARHWLQWNVRGGDALPWSSHKDVTIAFCRLEEFAREAAIGALIDERQARQREAGLRDKLLRAEIELDGARRQAEAREKAARIEGIREAERKAAELSELLRDRLGKEHHVVPWTEWFNATTARIRELEDETGPNVTIKTGFISDAYLDGIKLRGRIEGLKAALNLCDRDAIRAYIRELEGEGET